VSGHRLTDYLSHVAQAAGDAIGFVSGMDKPQFLADKRTQQAVLMSMVIIGEAAAKIIEQYPEFVQSSPQVPWRAMRSMRNRLTHGYFATDLDLVWDTVQRSLPALLRQLPNPEP
jgi:uncharacterized protein with HEPN domain